jgi:hypothetical protein
LDRDEDTAPTGAVGLYAASQTIVDPRVIDGQIHNGATSWLDDNPGSVVPDRRIYNFNIDCSGARRHANAGVTRPTATHFLNQAILDAHPSSLKDVDAIKAGIDAIED